ncbi:MAG: hypothetical protein JWR00_1054 [Rubritepida sp.]|nr:hypothetical protein [Rubritepida sp.]
MATTVALRNKLRLATFLETADICYSLLNRCMNRLGFKGNV